MKNPILILSCAALFSGMGVQPASADVFSFSFSGVDTNTPISAYPGPLLSGNFVLNAIVTANLFTCPPLAMNCTTPTPVFLLTGITGTLTDANGTYNIDGAVPIGVYPTGVAPNNNFIYDPPSDIPVGFPQIPGQPAADIDLDGISFYLTMGGVDYPFNLFFGQNFFNTPFEYNLDYGLAGEYDDGLDALTLFDLTTNSTIGAAPTPEPASIVLLGTGVLGALGVARRRFVR